MNASSTGSVKICKTFNLIASSLDHCGITNTNLDDYSNQLRNFVRSNQIVKDIEPTDDATSYDAEIFEDHHASESEPNEST